MNNAANTTWIVTFKNLLAGEGERSAFEREFSGTREEAGEQAERFANDTGDCEVSEIEPALDE